jgi:Lon protease-like protein
MSSQKVIDLYGQQRFRWTVVVVCKTGHSVALFASLTWPEQEGQMMNEIGDEEEIDRMVLAYSPKFQRILRAAKQQIRDDRGIKHQEFWRELEAKAK